MFLSLTIACSAWAEKYEYVRLKIKGASTTTIGFSYSFDSFALNRGDVATVIGTTSGSNGTIYVDDGEDEVEFEHQWGRTTTEPLKIVGPCTIHLAWHNSNTNGFVSTTTFAIQRASDTGSTTLAWNGTEWEGSNDDGSQNANNNSSSGGIDPTSIKYDELLGWAWFTDTNWVYSYTNLSWYYMHPTTEGFYVWNANLPDNGWMKLERG